MRRVLDADGISYTSTRVFYHEKERFAEVIRVPGGCLFWVLMSVILSVGLTVLANLILLLF